MAPAGVPTSPLQSDIVGKPLVAEFFAGIGLVRMGLEKAGFKVAWANDIDENKKQMYAGHFRDESDHYRLQDIAEVTAGHLEEQLKGEKLDLAWASFPCIDVSLAGRREGIHGRHTGTFWNFIDIIKNLNKRPPVVALENVVGLATSDNGEDLVKTVEALNRLDYSADVMIMDARRFVPHSRPRLFVVGVRNELLGTLTLLAAGQRNEALRPVVLDPIFKSDLLTHRAALPELSELKTTGLASCVERLKEDDERWWDEARALRFIESLTSIQLNRLHELKTAKTISYRTAYRRTRNSKPVWEIRADEIAGCLRTARGGSSKQAIVEAGRGRVRVRWMTGPEYAALMGAADYHLEGLRDNQIVFGFGDAVCVDVVEWLAKNYLMPIVEKARSNRTLV